MRLTVFSWMNQGQFCICKKWRVIRHGDSYWRRLPTIYFVVTGIKKFGMFYVISAGLKLQTSILLLSQVSKFKRAEKGPCHWCSRYWEAYKRTQKKKKTPNIYDRKFLFLSLSSHIKGPRSATACVQLLWADPLACFLLWGRWFYWQHICLLLVYLYWYMAGCVCVKFIMTPHCSFTR